MPFDSADEARMPVLLVIAMFDSFRLDPLSTMNSLPPVESPML